MNQGDFVGALDQAEAMLRDLAPVLATYRDSLIKAGFTREEALTLIIGLQQTLLGRTGGDAA